jgi:hypothetical protein
MICHYCDLCLSPFKEDDMYILRVSPPLTEDEIKAYYANNNDYWNKIKNEIKEICPTCKMLIDKIFQLRRDNLCELANQIETMYRLDINTKKKVK